LTNLGKMRVIRPYFRLLQYLIQN